MRVLLLIVALVSLAGAEVVDGTLLPNAAQYMDDALYPYSSPSPRIKILNDNGNINLAVQFPYKSFYDDPDYNMQLVIVIFAQAGDAYNSCVFDIDYAVCIFDDMTMALGIDTCVDVWNALDTNMSLMEIDQILTNQMMLGTREEASSLYDF